LRDVPGAPGLACHPCDEKAGAGAPRAGGLDCWGPHWGRRRLGPPDRERAGGDAALRSGQPYPTIFSKPWGPRLSSIRNSLGVAVLRCLPRPRPLGGAGAGPRGAGRV